MSNTLAYLLKTTDTRLAFCAFLVVGIGACATTVDLPPADEVPIIADEDGLIGEREALRTVAKILDQAPEPRRAATLLATVESLSGKPLYKNSKAKLLIDGPATYEAMLDAIAAAERYIYVETYIFADDDVGKRISDALIERAKAGVDVRLTYDAFGSRASDEDFFTQLKHAGVDVRPFNAMNPVRGGNPLKVNNRNHRKLLIVDGEVAFTGGINFSKYYSEVSEGRLTRDPFAPGWRDTHVAIYGPAVAGFEAVFVKAWNEECDAEACELEMAAAPSDAGQDLVAVLQGRGGDGDESSIYWAYLEAIRLAKERVWITQAYFAPDDRFMDFVMEAADRGVDVRLIVPAYSDTNVVVHASRARYGELLERGIEIFETTTTVLHAKTAVIDGIWSTVGSSNLDHRSFLHNHEVNAVIFGSSFGSQMEQQFERDVAVSEPVSLEAWKERPLPEKVKELAGRAVEYWL